MRPRALASLARALAACALVAGLAACAPKVQVATDKPIVLELHIRVEQEVRIKLDREVDALMDEERAAALTRRSLDGAPPPPRALALRAVAAARQTGQVGEGVDGYVALPDGAEDDAQLRGQVARVNAERRAEYAELAAEHGLPLADVAAVAGARRVAAARPGERVRGADGAWVTLPPSPGAAGGPHDGGSR